MNILSKKLTQNIEQKISYKTNKNFKIKNSARMSGGDVNQSFVIESYDQKYFLKINTHDNIKLFNSEVIGLNEIRKTKTIHTPEPIIYGTFNENSFLVLEFLELKPINNMKKLATDLASLHKNFKTYYGFESDNYIGKTIQKNNKNTSWIDFFYGERIAPQVEILSEKHETTKLVEKSKIIKKIMPRLFNNYIPKSSLLHGDLWQGNYAYNTANQAVIYDPACYYGDHEVDLAMMELFSNPGVEFFENYQQYFPVDIGYPKRRRLYNLYHILNHANMFGGYYLQQAETMMDQIIESI